MELTVVWKVSANEFSSLCQLTEELESPNRRLALCLTLEVLDWISVSGHRKALNTYLRMENPLLSARRFQLPALGWQYEFSWLLEFGARRWSLANLILSKNLPVQVLEGLSLDRAAPTAFYAARQ